MNLELKNNSRNINKNRIGHVHSLISEDFNLRLKTQKEFIGFFFFFFWNNSRNRFIKLVTIAAMYYVAVLISDCYGNG